MSFERGFDFSKLNPMATKLDLLIGPSQKLDFSATQVTRHVPSKIQARSGPATERIGNKSFGCEVRPARISTRYALTTKKKDSSQTHGRQFELPIQDIS